MRKVIVNSTPLIALSKANQLELLHRIYGEITIPQAVFNEVTQKNDLVKNEVASASWIHIETVRDMKAKRMYRAKLHDGEVEVMILAQEDPKADLVILDDNAAKKTAKFLGLTVTGTLGVILKAKKLGFIQNVSDLLDKLLDNGFYVSPEIQNLVKAEAGELN